MQITTKMSQIKKMIICCGVAMASLPFDGLDDLLFDMYKKQVLKHLRTRMTPNMEDAASNDEQQCQSESQSQVTECGEIVQVQCEATSFCYIF